MILGHSVGKLEVYDGDRGDTFTLHLRGPYSRIFQVTNDGDLIIDDLSHLNNTEAHLVAIARDSGIPPRETSVPVVVRFSDTLLKLSSQQSRAKDSQRFTLTVVLGLLLSVFLIICLGLLVYICKDKKRQRKNSPSNSPSPQNSNSVMSDQWNSQGHQRSMETDIYQIGSTKSSSVTSLPQLTGLGSTTVALNPLNPYSQQKYASSLNITNDRSTGGSIHQSGLPEMTSHQQALRDSILGGTGTDLSRLQWPRNSIPRRVKKL